MFSHNAFMFVMFSAEIGFKHLTLPYGWAKKPMLLRIKELQDHIKVAMLFGGELWVDNSMTEEMAAEMPDQFEVHTLRNCGHHVYADQPELFNQLVKSMCEIVDNEMPSEIELTMD